MNPQPTDAELGAIESEAIGQLVTKVRGTLPLAQFSALLLLATVYLSTSFPVWAACFVLNAGVSIHRHWFIFRYKTLSDQGKDATRFYLEHNHIFLYVGFAWGATAYLFYLPAPLISTVIYAFYALAYVLISAIYLSSHMRSLKLFMMGYTIGLVGALTLKMAIHPAVEVSAISGVVLFGVTWLSFTIYKFGKQVNKGHIESMLLQLRNKQLIESLTVQTHTALAAVDIKNRFLASAAHDMRQPVLALSLYSECLMDDPTSFREIIPKIALSAQSVTDMFDSMFDVARLSAGAVKPIPSILNLPKLLNELDLQFQPMARAKRLSLRMRISDCDLYTDPILLKRILGNLISNSIKYTDKGGVLVACRNKVDGLIVEVWDTGLGISPDRHALVFDEFYKNPENKGTSDGFGLGLSIVTQLTNLLGYKLTLKSQRGRGTVMSIALGKVRVRSSLAPGGAITSFPPEYAHRSTITPALGSTG